MTEPHYSVASFNKTATLVADRARSGRQDEEDEILATDIDRGLSTQEAQVRLAKWGVNEISSQNVQDSWLLLLARQFQSSVVILLLVAALISYLFAEHLQALAILVAVAINALVGFGTELRAKVSLKALSKLSASTIRARRDGQEIELPTSQLVPGDVIALEAGVRVPADVKLAVTCGMNVDESALTGESVPVYKSLSAEDEEVNDVVYQGTLVVDGQAWVIVIATALDSKLGQLGKLLTQVPLRRTPLELELEGLGKQLCWLMLALCVLLTLIGLWHQEPVMAMVQTSIALAVAAIPEGLAVVATLALAIGTHRMVKRAVLVRQLAAVETLGCCQIICSDKTGTLTENRMQVTDIYADGKEFVVSGEGYIPVGTICHREEKVDVEEESAMHQLLKASALCNDAFLEDHSGQADWHIHGDPTEGALIVAAVKAGLSQADLIALYPRIDVLPFDLTRKRMTTINQTPAGDLVAFTKGSPESVLKISKYINLCNETKELDHESIDWFTRANLQMSGKGLRVLAVARKELSGDIGSDVTSVESDLTLLGLIGMQDRPKPGVKEAIAACRIAGIRVMMLTGDQAQTAKAIAKDLGIITDSDTDDVVLTGQQLRELEESELETALKKALVLARVSPERKLSIVKALQKSGAVVAMTGDGVNDAPALRQADIGVAMGKGGADLARESAKIVITDDNFGSIVKAIEQGRVIYTNIQNAIAYLLTASLAAVMTVAGAVLFDSGLPLLPLQLLWLNLIMHVFPALGISLLPSHKRVMRTKPRKSHASIIGTSEYVQIVLRAVLVSLGVLLAIMINEQVNGHVEKMTTISFATLSCALLFQAWSWAWSGRSFIGENIWRNIRPALLINMFISYLLMVAAIYVSPLQYALKTARLDINDWLVVLFASGLSFVASIIATNFFYKIKAVAKRVGSISKYPL